ncbi:MAG TPA: crosslink repair DNA glycosylase YcaQ family protein [Solirubrobacterales bacterium]|nr:crosslink repair DNA glycosylase YcaQ family protein [Solirubrobacterales bacterium]
MTRVAAPARSFAEQLTTHLAELQAATPTVIAEHLVGIHAARVVSPLPIVAARTNDSARALPVLDFAPSSKLLRVRCMRKTLHILPRPLARLAHAATRRYRVRDAARPLVVHGLTARKFETLADRAVSIVSDHGPATPRELAEQVTQAARLTDHRLATLILRYCWEAGDLFVWRSPSAWDAERRVIGADARLRADFASLEAEDAQDQLLAHYFRRFGPASIRDACWWSGLSRGVVNRHLDSMGDRYLTYSAPWAESALYGLTEHGATTQRHADTDLSESDRRYTFLGHEDPILKAYFETRARYIDKANYSRLYNQIGEARPAIVANGHIVGVWQWDRQARLVTTSVFPQHRALRREVAAAGRTHADLLCTA